MCSLVFSPSRGLLGRSSNRTNASQSSNKLPQTESNPFYTDFTVFTCQHSLELFTQAVPMCYVVFFHVFPALSTLAYVSTNSTLLTPLLVLSILFSFLSVTSFGLPPPVSSPLLHGHPHILVHAACPGMFRSFFSPPITCTWISWYCERWSTKTVHCEF